MQRFFLKYPKTPKQFHLFIKDMQYYCKKHQIEQSLVTVNGTVKVHGTNTSFVYNSNNDDIWCQKRNDIITTESLFGFPEYFKRNKKSIKYLCSELLKTMHGLYDCVAVFGEWAGKGVQNSGSMVDEELTFYPFSLLFFNYSEVGDNKTIRPKENLTNYEWKTDQYIIDKCCFTLSLPTYDQKRLFKPLSTFRVYQHTIDLTNPLHLAKINNMMVDTTDKISKKCPVSGKEYGEGVVWSWITPLGEMFNYKSKDDKHVKGNKRKNVSNQNILNPVLHIELLAFVGNNVTFERVEQAIHTTCDDSEPKINDLGSIIKYTQGDVLIEEKETIDANFFNHKHLMAEIAKATKKIFFEIINK